MSTTFTRTRGRAEVGLHCRQPQDALRQPQQASRSDRRAAVTELNAPARQSIEDAVALLDDSARLESERNLVAAEAVCREALALFERQLGRDSPDTANAIYSLGTILEQRGNYAEAEECARRAASAVEPRLAEFDGPQGHLILVRSLGLLGTALRQQGAYRAAEDQLLRAISLAEALPGHPEEVAGAWNNLGVLCKFAGWFDRAEQAYARALHFARQQATGGELTIGAILHNVGGLEHARGAFDRAEEPARRAWEIRRTLLGEEHPDALADAVAYAAILDALGRAVESRPIYTRALPVYEGVFGPASYEVAATLHNLAGAEALMGQTVCAIQLLRRALAIKASALGTDHPDTALTVMNLGALLKNRKLLCRALAVFEPTLAADHPHITHCRELIVSLHSSDTPKPKREAE